MTKVDNMNEQIGFAYFFERGLERLDQRVGKFSQEPHCIGEKDALFVRQNKAARGRIKRRKKSIFGNDIRAGEQIQQRGLASIRITNHRGDRPLMSFAPFALDRARLAYRFELSLKP